jgi:hypothetical protein
MADLGVIRTAGQDDQTRWPPQRKPRGAEGAGIALIVYAPNHPGQHRHQDGALF